MSDKEKQMAIEYTEQHVVDYLNRIQANYFFLEELSKGGVCDEPAVLLDSCLI